MGVCAGPRIAEFTNLKPSFDEHLTTSSGKNGSKPIFLSIISNGEFVYYIVLLTINGLQTQTPCQIDQLAC